MSYDLKRREFLRVLMSLPVGYAVAACAIERRTPAQSALGKLVLALGPWGAEHGARADEFVGRFLTADHIVGLFLPQSSAEVEGLARRFADGAMAVGEVDLAALPDEERELAVSITQQLYSLIEVRFFVSSEPPWGECLGTRERYQQAQG